MEGVMKRFIIALADLYTGENKLHIVEAQDGLQAMKKVLEVEDQYFINIDEIKAYASDGDMLISDPYEIE